MSLSVGVGGYPKYRFIYTVLPHDDPMITLLLLGKLFTAVRGRVRDIKSGLKSRIFESKKIITHTSRISK